MPKNRVQELEVAVEELQATVAGLTEELVETKARLRELEEDSAPTAEPVTTNGPARSSEPALDDEGTDIIIC